MNKQIKKSRAGGKISLQLQLATKVLQIMRGYYFTLFKWG